MIGAAIALPKRHDQPLAHPDASLAVGDEGEPAGDHVAVEDLETLAPGEAGEVPLFHLHNLLIAEGGRDAAGARDTAVASATWGGIKGRSLH